MTFRFILNYIYRGTEITENSQIPTTFSFPNSGHILVPKLRFGNEPKKLHLVTI